MKKYVCALCGYVYDPAQGDRDGGIAPGTAFEDLPEGWTCPVCGATKEDFSMQDQLTACNKQNSYCWPKRLMPTLKKRVFQQVNSHTLAIARISSLFFITSILGE